MSDDLRERVARAMTAHHTLPWDEMPDIRKSRFLAYADAALAEFVGVRVSEPAPVSVREAARVLLDAVRIEPVHDAIQRSVRPAAFCAALLAIAGGKDDD